MINFGLIYGMSAFGLAKQLGVERSAAQPTSTATSPAIPASPATWKRPAPSPAKRAMSKPCSAAACGCRKSGRRNAGRRQGAERAAINAPMQGTAADLIKRAMIAVQDWLDAQKLNTLLVLQVHDELVLEVPDAELDAVNPNCRRLMAGVAKLKVPLLVEVGVGPTGTRRTERLA